MVDRKGVCPVFWRLQFRIFVRKPKLITLLFFQSAYAKYKIEVIPRQTWMGSGRLRRSDFLDKWHAKLRISALRTGRLCPLENTPGTRLY